MTPSTSAQCDRLPMFGPMGRRSMPPTLPSITPYTRPKLSTQAAAARPSEPGACQCFYFIRNINQGTPENSLFSLSKKYYFWIKVSKQQFIKIWTQKHWWAGHQRCWYFLAIMFPTSWNHKTLEIALLHVALAYGTFGPHAFSPVVTVVRWWSPRSRENDLRRSITSEPLDEIVCGWYHI